MTYLWSSPLKLLLNVPLKKKQNDTDLSSICKRRNRILNHQVTFLGECRTNDDSYNKVSRFFEKLNIC